MNVLGLFSGIGGFELGFQRAGFNIVAMCEIEPYARRVLGKHWPGVPIFDDVRTLTGEQLAPFKIDVITGGFPCQDISLAGKGAGITGARSGLWTEFHRIIAEVRPSWVVIENVSALRSRGLEQVLGALASIGYDAEWHCIPASAVGAPHRRDRVWIVAYPQRSEGIQRHRVNLFGRRTDEAEQTWLGSSGEDVANANDFGAHRTRAQGAGRNEPPHGRSLIPNAVSLDGGQRRTRGLDPSGARQHVAERSLHHPYGAVLEGQRSEPIRVGTELSELSGAGWWLVEPNVGRVAHGIPRRVDRLKGLGNAVVPQIPEMIALAIRDLCAT